MRAAARLAGSGVSSLFPFASCACRAPCWAPNRPLLHSGRVPSPARRSLPGPRSPFASFRPAEHNRPATRVLGGPPSPPSQGAPMASTRAPPHPQLPRSAPPGSLQSVCVGAAAAGTRTGRRGAEVSLHPPSSPLPAPEGPRSEPEAGRGGGGGGGRRRALGPLWMEARPGVRLTLTTGSMRRIGCGVYKNLGGLGLDESDDLLGEGQVLLG